MSRRLPPLAWAIPEALDWRRPTGPWQTARAQKAWVVREPGFAADVIDLRDWNPNATTGVQWLVELEARHPHRGRRPIWRQETGHVATVREGKARCQAVVDRWRHELAELVAESRAHEAAD